MAVLSSDSKYTIRYVTTLGGTDSLSRSITGLNFLGGGPSFEAGTENFFQKLKPFTQGQFENVRLVREYNITLGG